MQAGEPAKAVAKFTEAWKVFQHPAILKKRAEAYEQLQQYYEAVKDYRDYRKRLKPSDKKARRTIRERIKSLDALLAKPVNVTISSGASGVKVTLNGDNEHTTPFDLKLLPGEHQVAVVDKRYSPHSKTFRVRAGRSQTIKLWVVPRTGTVVITTDRDDFELTTIKLDARIINLGPTEMMNSKTNPRELVVGEHTLVCTEKGIPSYYTTFEVIEGKLTTVECDFSSISAGMWQDPWGWLTAGSGIASTLAGVALLVSYHFDVVTAEEKNKRLVTNKHVFGGVLIGTGVALGVASYFVFTRHVASSASGPKRQLPLLTIVPTQNGVMAGASFNF